MQPNFKNLKKTKPVIAFIARVDKLHSDDRIRKEVITLKQLGLKVVLFIHFKNNSTKYEKLFEGCEVIPIQLISRKIFSSSKLLIIKAIEFYFKVSKYLKNFDYIWCHEIYTVLFPFFLVHPKIIWDLHELPVNKKSFLKKIIFRFIESKTLFVIHANKFRLEFLLNQGYFENKKKHHVLRNFPDLLFYNSNLINETTKKAINWVGDEEYVYLQGLSNPARYPFNSIASVIESTKYKILVVGKFCQVAKKELYSKYGSLVDKRVLWIGEVYQLATPMLIKKSRFSIILYDSNRPNNRLCEPNRLYQTLGLGVPVVVGMNQSMSTFVEFYSAGIVLEDYGENLDRLMFSINELESQYLKIKAKTMKIYKKIVWDDENTIKKMIS